MDTTVLPVLNQQLLDLDRRYGSDLLALDVLYALLETIGGYGGDKSRSGLLIQLFELYELVLACRPRMANLVYDLQQLLCALALETNRNEQDLRSLFDELLVLKSERTRAIIQHAAELFTTDTRVLVHSHSNTVLALFTHLAEQGIEPQVFVAGQAPDKTHRVLSHLDSIRIPFSVVSEYSISHILTELDLAVFGGLTLTSHGDLIMGPGSGALISQLNLDQVPTYVLLASNKFSFWEQRFEKAFKETRNKRFEKINYTKAVFSHDTVPVSQLAGLITEAGRFRPDEIVPTFQQLQEEFFTREKEIRDALEGLP